MVLQAERSRKDGRSDGALGWSSSCCVYADIGIIHQFNRKVLIIPRYPLLPSQSDSHSIAVGGSTTLDFVPVSDLSDDRVRPVRLGVAW